MGNTTSWMPGENMALAEKFLEADFAHSRSVPESRFMLELCTQVMPAASTTEGRHR